MIQTEKNYFISTNNKIKDFYELWKHHNRQKALNKYNINLCDEKEHLPLHLKES